MEGHPVRIVLCRSAAVVAGVVGLAASWTAPSVEAAAVKTVVIDAGHGDHDRGGTDGLVYEKHLSLDVARRLDVYLRSKGIQTVMTRTRDKFISLPSRCYIANRRRNSVFVSIHFNETSRAGAKGIETFYAGSSGKALGERVHSRLISQTRAENRGLKWKGYYVLRNTKVPAILVECGFLSNSWEKKRCLAPWYRQLVAQNIGDGIVKYMDDRRRGKVR